MRHRVWKEGVEDMERIKKQTGKGCSVRRKGDKR